MDSEEPIVEVSDDNNYSRFDESTTVRGDQMQAMIEDNLFFDEDVGVLNQYKYNQAVQQCIDPLGTASTPFMISPLKNEI